MKSTNAQTLKRNVRLLAHTLVCTKNTVSYQAQRQKDQQDQDHLATLLAIQATLPR